MAGTTRMARSVMVALAAAALAAPSAVAAELRLGVVGNLDGIDDPLVRPGEGADLVRALISVPLVGLHPGTLQPGAGAGVAAGWHYARGAGVTFTLRRDTGLTPARIADDLTTQFEPRSDYAEALGAVEEWKPSGADLVADLEAGSAGRSWSLLGSGVPVAGARAPYAITQADRTSAKLVRRHGSGPDRIAVTAFASGDDLADALADGRIDVADGIPRARFARIGTERDVLTYRAPAPVMTVLAFGVGSPAAGDSGIRRALALAVNRSRLVAGALDGLGEPARAAVLGAFYHRPGLALARYDVAEARELLDRRGWEPSPDGVRRRGATRASLEVLVNADAPDELAATEMLADMARVVGIELQLAPASPGEVQAILRGRSSFQALVTSLRGTPEPGSLLERFLSSAESNPSGYASNPYDDLYADQDAEADPTARSRLIGELERILLEDAPAVFLYSRDRLMAVRTTRFDGWQATPAPVGLPASPYTPQPLLALRAREPNRWYSGPYVAGALLLGLACTGLALRALRALARRRQPLEHEGEAV